MMGCIALIVQCWASLPNLRALRHSGIKSLATKIRRLPCSTKTTKDSIRRNARLHMLLARRRTQWARDWVNLWADSKDPFYTTAMEQTAYVGTLKRMGDKGLIDFNRILMLRSASNYSMPPSGQSVTSTMGDESTGTDPAFEAQYLALAIK